MINVLIVDDEKPCIELLKQEIANIENIDIVGEFTNSKKALNEIDNLSIDVILADIQMPGLSGIDFAKNIFKKNPEIKIVFTTAYDNYAIESYEIGAIDYILKPVTKKRLEKTFNRFYNTSNFKKPINIKVNSFGYFAISYNNKELKWRTAKAKEIAAFLIFNEGRPIHCDEIIKNIWGENNLLDGRKKLHATIYHTRKTFKKVGLDDIISFIDNKYQFNLDINDFFFDLRKFEQLLSLTSFFTVNDNNIHEAEEIFNLYRGVLFEKENYIWSREKQEEISMKYEKLLFKLAEYHEYKENYKETIKYLQKLTYLNIFNDEAHKMMLNIHKQNGGNQEYNKYLSWISDIYEQELGIPFES